MVESPRHSYRTRRPGASTRYLKAAIAAVGLEVDRNELNWSLGCAQELANLARRPLDPDRV